MCSATHLALSDRSYALFTQRRGYVFSEIGQAGLVTFLTFWRLTIHRLVLGGSDQAAKPPLKGKRQHIEHIGLGFAFGTAHMRRPLGVHRCRSAALRRFAVRSGAALRGAVQ
jgi:hypothetical protein